MLISSMPSDPDLHPSGSSAEFSNPGRLSGALATSALPANAAAASRESADHAAGGTIISATSDKSLAGHVDQELLMSIGRALLKDAEAQWDLTVTESLTVQLTNDVGDVVILRDGDAPAPHTIESRPGRIIVEGWLGDERVLLNQHQVRPYIYVTSLKTVRRTKMASVARQMVSRYRPWHAGMVKLHQRKLAEQSSAAVSAASA